MEAINSSNYNDVKKRKIECVTDDDNKAPIINSDNIDSDKDKK